MWSSLHNPRRPRRIADRARAESSAPHCEKMSSCTETPASIRRNIRGRSPATLYARSASRSRASAYRPRLPACLAGRPRTTAFCTCAAWTMDCSTCRTAFRSTHVSIACLACPRTRPRLRSLHVINGYVPPEFGFKTGAVVEVRTETGIRNWTGTIDTGVGDLDTERQGSSRSHRRWWGLMLTGSDERSSRFLDPVALENFHNEGRSTASAPS